ncbi:RHS repeat-associated core domain-containing protein [Lihuaxuella thermophila]|uniref:RHS repeat-associated core domain-containing protein n=2 Tax=Lihuaxuella thermophila TaxID=1173111 RepID=A0A1H8JKT8_9BACL|nr:RHS repeat-associated core domain-containing protein [Lihuaxuella thermophila]
MTRGGQTYYYQLNGHGDVVALTDSSGAVVATYEYDAYGNLLKETGTIENPYRYAGYRYDKAVGLYYLQTRYYNPSTGRFLTKDTFDGFNQTKPLSLNKFAYVENNPVLYTDEDGRWAKRRYWRILVYEYNYFTMYIPQYLIDQAAYWIGIPSTISKYLSGPQKKQMKEKAVKAYRKLIRKLKWFRWNARAVGRFLGLGIASLWVFSKITGSRGVTLGISLLVIKGRWWDNYYWQAWIAPGRKRYYIV